MTTDDRRARSTSGLAAGKGANARWLHSWRPHTRPNLRESDIFPPALLPASTRPRDRVLKPSVDEGGAEVRIRREASSAAAVREPSSRRGRGLRALGVEAESDAARGVTVGIPVTVGT